MSLQLQDDLREEKTNSEAARGQADKQASEAKKEADGLLGKMKSDAAEEQEKAKRAADGLLAQVNHADAMLSDAIKYALPQNMIQLREHMPSLVMSASAPQNFVTDVTMV